MLKLSPKATTESARSSTNGAVYPPVEERRLLLAVAIKDAKSRLKFVMLKFVGKYFLP